MKKLLLILLLFFPVHGAWGHDLSGEIYFECIETKFSQRTQGAPSPNIERFSVNYTTKTVIERNTTWEKEKDDVFKLLDFGEENINWKYTSRNKIIVEYSFARVTGGLITTHSRLEPNGRISFINMYKYFYHPIEKKY